MKTCKPVTRARARGAKPLSRAGSPLTLVKPPPVASLPLPGDMQTTNPLPCTHAWQASTGCAPVRRCATHNGCAETPSSDMGGPRALSSTDPAHLATCSHCADELVRFQKHHALGEIAGSVAHEYNNILAVIFGYVDILLNEGRLDADSQDLAQQIFLASQRAIDLTRHVLVLSRDPSGPPPFVNLGRSVQEMEVMIKQAMPDDVELVLRNCGQGSAIQVHEGYLHQLVLTIVLAASPTLPQGGRLVVEATDDPPPFIVNQQVGRTRCGAQAGISFTFAGTGSAALEKRERMFAGSALGLGTLKFLAVKTDAKIVCEEGVRGGLRFWVLFSKVEA